MAIRKSQLEDEEDGSDDSQVLSDSLGFWPLPVLEKSASLSLFKILRYSWNSFPGGKIKHSSWGHSFHPIDKSIWIRLFIRVTFRGKNITSKVDNRS